MGSAIDSTPSAVWDCVQPLKGFITFKYSKWASPDRPAVHFSAEMLQNPLLTSKNVSMRILILSEGQTDGQEQWEMRTLTGSDK